MLKLIEPFSISCSISMGAWAKCAPLLQPAIDRLHGTHLPIDILIGVDQGAFHLWKGDETAAITETIVFPRRIAVNVFLVGGELQESLEWMNGGALDRFAFDRLGVDAITWTGRPGWKKHLRDFALLGEAGVRERKG